LGELTHIRSIQDGFCKWGEPKKVLTTYNSTYYVHYVH